LQGFYKNERYGGVPSFVQTTVGENEKTISLPSPLPALLLFEKHTSALGGGEPKYNFKSKFQWPSQILGTVKTALLTGRNTIWSELAANKGREKS